MQAPGEWVGRFRPLWERWWAGEGGSLLIMSLMQASGAVRFRFRRTLVVGLWADTGWQGVGCGGPRVLGFAG
jgi:hypothetical protein